MAIIRREWPRVPIFARARDNDHAFELLKAGATQIIPEALEASLQLATFVLQTLGIPESEVILVVDQERNRHIDALDR